jgi:hypothetical protein
MAPDAEQPPGMTPTPKQVVFLFMAGTVTAVVAFLLGVLVGRGAAVSGPPAAGPDGAGRDDRPALVGGEALEDLSDALGVDGLSYYYRLESETAIEETLHDPQLPGREPRGPLRPLAAPSGGTGEGFTVQVGALKDRDLAQRIADQLVSKGFPAFVADPERDAPVAMYRIRVGRYAEHGVAERMKRRLEAEEHFQPWITR